MSPLAQYVVETLFSLLVIIGLASLVVMFARRTGLNRINGPMELLGRLPLDGRRAVYLVRVQSRVFVLAASEAGLRKIAELDKDSLEAELPAPKSRFAEVLSQALKRAKPERPSDSQHGPDEDAA